MAQVYSFVDENGVTRLLAEIHPDPAGTPFNGGTITGALTITDPNPADTPLTINGAVAQSFDLLDVLTNAGQGVFVSPGGGMQVSPDPNTTAFVASANVADAANFTSALGAIGFRCDLNGAPIVGVNAAPADAVLQNGQCALWFDSTNGAPRLKLKGKQADGTVVTASIVLA